MFDHSLQRESPRTCRNGTTLLELCAVLLVMAALFAIALPRLRAATDRAAARSAVQDAASVFSLGRRAAIARRAFVTVMIDTTTGTIVTRDGGMIILARGLRAEYGVRLASSRDSMAYDPRGLGYGAANLSVIARRGQAAETLFVSRLGRARH